MKTELLYLEDTYQFSGSAKFLEMRENEKGSAVILDKTIFYPQGGGQPTDTGKICSADAIFNVTFVGLDPEGVVWHFGEFEKGSFVEGDEVSLEVHGENRKLYARLHSAGHLIDYALVEMGSDIKMDKGFHFVEGPYVEGFGEVEDLEAFKETIEKKVNEIVEQGLPMQKEVLDEGEVAKRGLVAPLGKSIRIVGFGEHVPCGCGGTHVSNSKDVGKITIRKVARKKDRIKISYAVDA